MITSFEILALSGLEITLIGAVVLLLYFIWCLTRHQECRRIDPPEGGIGELLPALAGSTRSHLTFGNGVELVQDAEFFDRVIEAIEGAEHTVNLEAFLWWAGEAADRTSAALIDAVRRGVEVRILVDARGSSKMGTEREAMEESGCRIASYHRWSPGNLGRFNLRDHRKIVVIDGRVAYVGGHCFADIWLKDSDSKKRYRDITARFTGPVVADVQSTFSENWSEATEEYLISNKHFPQLRNEGDALAHVVSIKPDGSPSAVQVLHYAAIAFARKRIRIQNPYFLPDPCGIKQLARAAQRGVDVRIMTPAVGATDNKFVTLAGQFTYAALLKAGVRIFEYQPTLIHQKVITVDGEWCGIGSSNFDDRSFEINDEITVGIADQPTVSALDEIFEADSECCEELMLEDWERRGLKDRAISAVCYLFNEQF